MFTSYFQPLNTTWLEEKWPLTSQKLDNEIWAQGLAATYCPRLQQALTFPVFSLYICVLPGTEAVFWGSPLLEDKVLSFLLIREDFSTKQFVVHINGFKWGKMPIKTYFTSPTKMSLRKNTLYILSRSCGIQLEHFNKCSIRIRYIQGQLLEKSQ